jgi:hypothetical protein
MSWEPTLQTWAQGPSTTEQEKCANAERVVSKAIRTDSTLSAYSIDVFTQGSYQARTNVRQDSDVDICARLTGTFFYQLPPNTTPSNFGIVPASLTFTQYKSLIGDALAKALGKDGVTPGNKAFDVHENTYRIDADVLPAFEHRRYQSDGSYHSGIEFLSDDGYRTINWPQHTHDNGIAKHNRTGRRYKRAIRILKRLRNAMQDQKITAANNVASFLIESLVWNVPDSYFATDTYTDMIRNVLAHTASATSEESRCYEWGEVNELKYLFRGRQAWTRDQANSFLLAAWTYLGF